MTTRQLMMLVLVPAFSALVACASAETLDTTPAPDVGDGAAIMVQHNIPGATLLSIHLVDPVGTPRLIGSVAQGEVATFEVETPVTPGEYTLVAEAPDGRTVTSRPFFLSEDEAVRWDLMDNIVRTIGTDGAARQNS